MLSRKLATSNPHFTQLHLHFKQTLVYLWLLPDEQVDNTRTKHIDIKYHFIRDMILKKQIDVIYCPTNDMVADIFTKGLPKVTFEHLRTKMGVLKIREDSHSGGVLKWTWALWRRGQYIRSWVRKNNLSQDRWRTLVIRLRTKSAFINVDIDDQTPISVLILAIRLLSYQCIISYGGHRRTDGSPSTSRRKENSSI